MTAKDRLELDAKLQMLERDVEKLKKQLAASEIKDKEHECLDRKRPTLPNLPRSDT